MFAAIGTRPDISFAVNQLAQFSRNPSEAHWNEVKQIFAYLKETSDFGITYHSNTEAIFTAYADADYAGNVDDRKSTSGAILSMNGSSVAWVCKRQRCVSLSTTEAQYVAACTAAKEIV